ncbi:hypothetical protein BDZ94DRAFT_705120 [Collybia nuda]|uniref:Uncharacterized protein n=1 Tax=Collybia nuda TaxID=64659 RepID=A0A9P5Y7S2_9AGAR|nr:hypothetical protein BDZ94DRAFT_705120 [Collybia nuda]
MTTLRAQAPPVNLKERIAALQQRGVSPGPRATSPSPAPVVSPSSAGLRDKIARFEKKGGIPVPRGSFGLGAPPLAENGPARRRGELYGNRIPGAVRASGGGPTTSRSVSPFESSRSFSLSALDTDEVDASAFDEPSSPTPTSPASPFLGPSVEHTGIPRPTPRGTSFATALDIARKAESSGEASFGRLEAHEASASPSPASRTLTISLEPLIGDELGEIEFQESPPAIIISSDESPHTPDLESHNDNSTTTSIPTTSSNTGMTSPPNPSEEEIEVVPPEVDQSGRQTSPLDAEVLEPVVAVMIEPPVPSASEDIKAKDEPISTPAEDEINPTSLDQTPPLQDALDTKKPLPQIPPPSPDAMSAAISSECLPIDLDSAEEVAVSEGALSEAIQANSPTTTDDASIIEAAIQVSENLVDPPPQGIEQSENSDISQKKARPEEIEILSPNQIQSPAGPLTLADAVFALGQTVANIQGLFPDQISPLATPPAYRSLHIDSEVDDGIRTHHREESLSRDQKKKPSVDLTIQVESPPDVAFSVPTVEETAPKPEENCEVLIFANNGSSVTITEIIPQTYDHPDTPEALLPTPDFDQHIFLTTPSTGGRPVSMIETPSPSHIAQAHRVTPLTSRGVPVFVPAVREPQDFGHFPPTPDREETEFGTASVHKQSHSFSHARTYVSHGQTDARTSTFKAVVHTKVTELPSSVSMPVIPQTPQMNRTKRSVYGDVPPSPGYGELAALLQEAALLEETLEKGELPDEAVRQEALEKKRLGEKVAAERAAAEEKRRARARSKSREKRDEPETRPKSSFSTMLRSKSYTQKDVLSSEAPVLSARDHARAKTVLYPHRPSHGSRQAHVSQKTLETHDEVPHVDSDPNQTSPKSRQYFAGLRRLASTSRPSIGSTTHPRHSASTSSEISSEDSASVVTPPDGGLDSAGSGHGVSWPSLSPKKSPGSVSGGVSRAASFAGKMWSRTRTKSTISTNS